MVSEFVRAMPLVIPLILVGVGLVLVSQWARKRNADLNAIGVRSKSIQYVDALRRQRYRQAVRILLFGNEPRALELIGRGLAVVVILLVAAFFIFILYAIYHEEIDQFLSQMDHLFR